MLQNTLRLPTLDTYPLYPKNTHVPTNHLSTEGVKELFFLSFKAESDRR